MNEEKTKKKMRLPSGRFRFFSLVLLAFLITALVALINFPEIGVVNAEESYFLGNTGVGGSTSTAAGRGLRIRPINGDGYVSNITIYAYAPASTVSITCALYKYVADGDAGVFINATETKVVDTTPQWTTFDFATQYDCPVTNDTYYYIVWWSGTGNVNFKYITGGSVGFTISSTTGYPTFPSPLTGETSSTASVSMYCGYVVSEEEEPPTGAWVGHEGTVVTAASGYFIDIQTAVDAVVADNNWTDLGNGKQTLGAVVIPDGTYEFWTETESLAGRFPAVNVSLGVDIFAEFAPTGEGVEVSANGTGLEIPTTWGTILKCDYSFVADVNSSSYQVPVWFNLGKGGINCSLWSWSSPRLTNASIRISGIQLQGPRTIDINDNSFARGCAVWGVIDYRVDHCYFLNIPGGGVYVGNYYDQNKWCCGVTDHNRFVNTYKSWSHNGNMYDGNIAYGINYQRMYYPDGGDWENDSMALLGHYNNRTHFAENNYFYKWRHCIASGNNAFYVSRYNYFNYSTAGVATDLHGLRSASPNIWGSRGSEYYENTYVNYNDTMDCGHENTMRGVHVEGGGCGVWFNNNIDSSFLRLYFYPEDQVASELCHLNDFYAWSALGDLINPTMSNPLSDFAGRNVYWDWSYIAGNISDVGYPNVNASWSINGYVPFPYPHYLTLEDGEPPTYYTLTIEATSGGSVSPTVGDHEYLENSNITLIAFPSSGYSFVDWEIDGANQTATATWFVYMDDNHTAKAYFSPTPVVLTITLPQATEYTTGSIPVQLSASGGTIDKIWYNAWNTSDWVYPANQTYSAPTEMTSFVNGTYTFYGWCNNTGGSADEKTVEFTVAIPTIPEVTVTIFYPEATTYSTGTIPVHITASGGTIDVIWYNCKNGSDWIFVSNQTYTEITEMLGFVNGTYTFYAWANNTDLEDDEDSIEFTVEVISGNGDPEPTPPPDPTPPPESYPDSPTAALFRNMYLAIGLIGVSLIILSAGLVLKTAQTEGYEALAPGIAVLIATIIGIVVAVIIVSRFEASFAFIQILRTIFF